MFQRHPPLIGWRASERGPWPPMRSRCFEALRAAWLGFAFVAAAETLADTAPFPHAEPFSAARETTVRYDDGAGGQMWYRLYLPEDFDPARSYPLTTFLHGNDGTNIRPVDDPENDVGRAPQNLVDALASGPYESILVAPQLEQGAWGNLGNDRLIREALDTVQATYQTDPRRRYLTGLSFGSFGSFHMIGEFPDYFAAAVPIAGGYFPPFDPDDPFSQNTFETYVETVKDIPVWAFHGSDDIVVNVSATRGVVEALRAGDANVRYSELPREPHNIWDQVYDKDDFPPTAVFRLEVDTQSQTFQVLVSVDPTQSRGLHRYSVKLVGADTIRNVAPKSDSSPVTGGPVGFTRGRTGNDENPLIGFQSTDFTDGSLVEGFGQFAGEIPGAGNGDGEVQPQYDAPLLIAEGTYSDLEGLDFSAEPDARGLLSVNAIVVRDDFPFAVAYTELVHDGEVVYSRGDHQSMYPWLFSQRLAVPEPSALLLAGLGALAFADGRRQAAKRARR